MKTQAVLGGGVLLLALFLVANSSSEEPPTPKTEPQKEAPKRWQPDIPKTWDEKALATLDVPLVVASATPQHVTAEYYYSIPERKIWKSYPIYHPDHEPEGYFEELQKKEPEPAIDFSKLATREDWIAAGEIAFDAPIIYSGLTKVSDVRDRSWYKESGMPITREGIMPFTRYVIREKGKVEIAEFGCGTCHTRVMPDGSVIRGAQGNYPLARLDAMIIGKNGRKSEDPEEFMTRVRKGLVAHYAAPWVAEDPAKRHEEMSLEDFVAVQNAIPAGVQHRFGASYFHPVQVPDLIGIQERRYLDRTGHIQHRDIGDLMRYGSLNQDLAYLDLFGDFRPYGQEYEAKYFKRYSDEALYALSLFIYSLEPPKNPNPVDELSALGKKVFQREECWRCHKPPLYTNNRLTPVDGFEVPPDHPQSEDIIPFSVGTDPGLAMNTRRGTGLYKVPSLKGVWYRGPFEHSGSVATLEDWFDPKRLSEDYVPTGFRGYKVETRAIKGHRFGLELSEEERKALIAFLRTL